jgi:hypothetical protein
MPGAVLFKFAEKQDIMSKVGLRRKRKGDRNHPFSQGLAEAWGVCFVIYVTCFVTDEKTCDWRRREKSRCVWDRKPPDFEMNFGGKERETGELVTGLGFLRHTQLRKINKMMMKEREECRSSRKVMCNLSPSLSARGKLGAIEGFIR